MEKHRLELFSDGVFVIVLTLLVLDLKPPAHGGLTGLREIAPGLAVHALTFYIVGLQWLSHHNMLAGVSEIRTRTLTLNLIGLFFVTLIPFGARIAAEDPLDGLGIGFITACRAFYGVSMHAMALSSPWSGMHDPASRGAIVRVRWIGRSLTLAYFVAAALCVVSPWFGYAVIPLSGVFFMLPQVSRMHAQARTGGRVVDVEAGIATDDLLSPRMPSK
jgi:uncharacterized membrane protein